MSSAQTQRPGCSSSARKAVRDARSRNDRAGLKSKWDNAARREIEHGEIAQVDPANFKTGIRVVFPQGLVERGDDLLVYYGAADVSVAAARVRKRDLVASLAEAIKLKQSGVPL